MRKGKRKLLRVNMTRASTGTLVVSARCGRKRLGSRIDVERVSSAVVGLRGAKGTCSVTANLRPAATYQVASAKNFEATAILRDKRPYGRKSELTQL